MKSIEHAKKLTKKRRPAKQDLRGERERLSELVRKSLKPVAKSPSGLAFYDYDEVASLNVPFPKKR